MATRPLTLKEMNIALNIEDDHRNYDDLDLGSPARFESSLRNLCGFFVTVVNQKVYLIHHTAKEFLIRKSETFTGPWKHSLDPVESELVMAKVCVTYLMLSLFDGPVNYSSTASVLDFFDYAAAFWAPHFQKAQHRATPQLVQSVTRVCNVQTLRFQAWFNTYWYTNHQQWPMPQFTDVLIIGSYFGLEVVVRRLLDLGTVHLNGIDEEYRRTPLLWAAEGGTPASSGCCSRRAPSTSTGVTSTTRRRWASRPRTGTRTWSSCCLPRRASTSSGGTSFSRRRSRGRSITGMTPWPW